MIKEYQLRKLQNSYEVTLYYKGVKVRVAFTGGNVYKSTMPKFRTNDLFKMKAIENSELFKNREVVVVRTINEKSDVRPTTVVQQRKTAVKPAVQKPAPKPEPPKVQEPVTQEPTSGEGEPETKEFANLGEAILYIAQTWQEQAKTEKEAREILKAHGINPKIKKG